VVEVCGINEILLKRGGSVVSHERLRAMYQIDDMILTFTHNRADSNTATPRA
jgi:hypothetical protein